MQQPEFYPHETEPEIRLVQTHLSYVLLTGPYAYKVSKCVRLNFVDYSTLSARKHFCEEEVRLNRLYAPDLYVDVVPFYGAAGSFSMSPTAKSEPVEFAVRMHQFEDRNLLQHVFDRGELAADDIQFVAKQIARFHLEAATSDAISKYGAPSLVAKMLDDVYESLGSFAASLWTARELETMRKSTNRVVRARDNLLAKRAAEGFVRECHGDLHLGNICYFKGRIEFFDRIVFNDAFKNIDVFYDLAFLYMDLEYRRRPDLANVLLNTYLEATNDFGGVLLLAFYTGCRALIRANVSAIESEEPEYPTNLRPEAEQEAKAHFSLAMRYAERPAHANATIMCGVSGSGKSTVAAEIAARTGAIRIRSDAVRNHLTAALSDADSETKYGRRMTEQTYAYMIDRGVELAEAGYPVVLDATFGERQFRRQAIARFETRNIPARFVICDADRKTLQRRVSEREGDLSDADEHVLEHQLEQFEMLEPSEIALATVVDTGGPIDYVALSNPDASERSQHSVRG